MKSAKHTTSIFVCAQNILAGTQNSTLHVFATKTLAERHVLHSHTLGNQRGMSFDLNLSSGPRKAFQQVVE